MAEQEVSSRVNFYAAFEIFQNLPTDFVLFQLAKALKDLPTRIQTASKREREENIENVLSVLAHPSISESIVRGICKILLLTIPRYTNSHSQNLVRRLVQALATQHPEWTFKYLIPALHDTAAKHNLISARYAFLLFPTDVYF